jgi:ornithine carbamoyltransferase
MVVKGRARRTDSLAPLHIPMIRAHRLPMDRPKSPRPAATPSDGDAEAVLSQARALWRAERNGEVRPLLKGRRLGLLCDDPESADAQLFVRAAGDLGAHVSPLRPTLSRRTPAAEVEATARLLGRLYDALECQCREVDPEMLDRLRSLAGVAVFDGLATATHPSAALAERLGAGIPAPERRRLVVEAVMVTSLS